MSLWIAITSKEQFRRVFPLLNLSSIGFYGDDLSLHIRGKDETWFEIPESIWRASDSPMIELGWIPVNGVEMKVAV